MINSRLGVRNGSITVEAAVMVPIVIIAVLLVVYILLIIFQSCIMQVVANEISEKAATTWLTQNASFETGKITKVDISELGLYRRWSSSNSLESELKEAAVNRLRDISILKGKDVNVEVEYQNTLLSRKVTIELSASYNNPLGALTGTWGVGRSMKLKVQSQAVIDDPVEFIRNLDFITETASSIPLINEFESKWNEIVSKIVEYVNSLSKER